MQEIIIILAWFSTIYTVSVSLVEVGTLYKAIKKKKGMVQNDVHHTAEHIWILVSLSIFVTFWTFSKFHIYYFTSDDSATCFYFVTFFNILFSVFALNHFKKERVLQPWTPFNTKI